MKIFNDYDLLMYLSANSLFFCFSMCNDTDFDNFVGKFYNTFTINNKIHTKIFNLYIIGDTIYAVEQ